MSNLCLISDNFAVFATFQVLIGASAQGASLTTYILRKSTASFARLPIYIAVMEFLSGYWRTVLGIW